MRLGNVRTESGPVLAELRDGEYRSLSSSSLEALLGAGTDPTELDPLHDWRPLGRRDRLAAPLRPGKIIAVGLNYLDHIREAGVDRPQRPVLFSKLPSSVIGPGDTIFLDPTLCGRVDWEVELAVVVGARLRDVSPDDALEGVFGYTGANDLSARDVQMAEQQWLRAKGFDCFCPLGPSLLTSDEVPDPQALSLATRVNGETMQDSSTAQMLLGVAEIVSYSSRGITLEPGDVLLTGTPWGCGEFMSPPRSLADGDLVEVEVGDIGVLDNRVRVRV